ncbi:MSMEG_0565 family glycosyltransferase [Rhizobium sp. FY34]|uniref:MSMEG_0565 family glycosyltransferase n=1 Tax=Rhizobium sp. FY34 TaxID=2562309 RepID=UPI0010C11B01|nr:MSMEG_0565 family glycosyltransferase [Rhizobium sp. FY34]
MSRPLRIAMLTHSTNPRGGVVHALHLSEALVVLGHEVVLHAPDAVGKGFFRKARCGSACFSVGPAPAGMTAMVEQRIADYVTYFESPAARDFDIFHAHDGISGNALARLKERRLIDGFARTVHHIDQFSDPRLMVLQRRSIAAADCFFTVSRLWRGVLAAEGKASVNVGNGVDIARFSPRRGESDARLSARLGLPRGPVFLSIGGVEARKNSVRILKAFTQVRSVRPDAQLVIAGGVSLLDHGAYQSEFRRVLDEHPALGGAVHIIGAVADEDMPALFRLADTLVFPSVTEGFGLVVLEAMASGVPVVVSSIAPFTEYLTPDDALWCDPLDPASIAQAMIQALAEPVRQKLRPRGLQIGARHSWERTAEAHIASYLQLREHAHA